jgi:hypothetical protein
MMSVCFKTICLWFVSVVVASGALDHDVGVWTVDSLTRVFREQPARPQVEPKLGAARGEWESFQLILTGAPKDLRGARVTATTLLGAQGKELPAPEVLRQQYVKVKVSSPQSPLPAGDYPDVLVPQSFPEAELPDLSMVNQPFWVDVFVPHATPAGLYAGSLDIQLREGENKKLGFTVEVWDFDLPVVPRMKSSFWLGWRRIAEVHGFDKNAGEPDAKLEPILEAYETLLAEHRLSIDQVRASYPDANSGRLDVERVEKALRKHLLHRHAATIGVPIFPTWPFEDPLGRDREKAQRYLADWMKILHRFQCGSRGYIALGDLDEPNDAAAYERVRQWGALVNEAEKKHGVKLPLMITEQPTPDQAEWGVLDGAPDIWVPHFSAVYQDLEHPSGKRRITQRLAAGEEVWTYAALVQLSEEWKEKHGFPEVVSEGHPPVWMIDYPAINHRILPWLMKPHGITGLAYWDLLHYPEEVDPWTDAGTFRSGDEIYNGDGLYVYPAARRRHGVDMPIASMRLKWLRDAVDDFDYLSLAMESNEGARARVLEVTRTFARGFGDWTDDVPALLKARWELGQLLGRKLSTPTGTLQSASSP